MSSVLTQLVDELGNAVRLEGGQLELQTEELDLRTVAQEAAERAQVQTDRHQIRVSQVARCLAQSSSWKLPTRHPALRLKRLDSSSRDRRNQ